jgi:signal transduction histidine kinase
MKEFFKKIIQAGVRADTPKFRAKAIVMANIISILAVVLCTLILIYYLRDGWNWFDAMIILTILVLCAIPALNFFGLTRASRFLLSIALPMTGLTMTLAGRIQNPDQYEYTRSPGIYCVLLASAVIPVLIFSSREKLLMLFCLGINFMFFISLSVVIRYYSVLHEFPTMRQYISANLAVVFAYLLLVGSVLALKAIIDDYEVKNEVLIGDLNEKNSALEGSNRELHELYKNIETQNEEIVAQSEELIQSQESLILANNEIERQKLTLKDQNEFLSKTLDERSKDLLFSNKQLVTQNNELQQFSYTVSHNLRGPVASMLGLLNIHQYARNEQEKEELLSLLKQSAQSLETVIVDLNKIIDIRNDKFSAYEDITLEHELSLVKKSLSGFILASEGTIEESYEIPAIRSVKTYIHSIFYNLISNAIQYRSPERKLHIRITTRAKADKIIFRISDNGLGIDLVRFRSDLFKLYKRFHTHTPGKGLGLYLVHQQVEKLNGHIEVESQPDVGTTFEISLPLKASPWDNNT